MQRKHLAYKYQEGSV